MSQTTETIPYLIHRLEAQDPDFVQHVDDVADFLFDHLDEYGDPRDHIMNCLHYASGKDPGQGGFILVARGEDGRVYGAVVINQTNMRGYIPENILVYIAVDRSTRGTGLGTQLMKQALAEAEGDIALHVEPDNPARKLYEKLGFTNKYLEMRFHKG